MIKSIVFDFAGVIAAHTLRSWFEMHNLNKEIYREITKKWDIGEIDQNESFRLISEKIGLPQDKIYDSIFKPIIFNKQIVDIIKQLKKEYKIALFSDNISSIVIRQLEDNHLLELFDTIHISSDHKMTKAQDEYFLKLLNDINLSPDEVVFIDDTQNWVDRGNRLGIKSFLFVDGTKLRNDLRSIDILI